MGVSWFVEDIMKTADPAVAVSFKLSAFHTTFNICNVLILIWFVKLIEKTVCKIIPQREQDEEYRKSVIPDGVPVFGLTAGLPSTLRCVVGPHGRIYGLDHFGASAPYKVLDEKFGFTVQNITEQVLRFLHRL